MAGLSESQALTTSIGEYTRDTLGVDNLNALRVTMNPRESCAFIMIALSDGSDDSQRRAIRTLFDIERIYSDDVALEYVFVDEIPERDKESAEAPQFTYA